MTTRNPAIAMKVAEMASMFPQREISEGTIIGYVDRLSQHPADLIVAAIDALIETAEWFPTLAQILDAAGLGGNAAPPFVLPIGPTTHRATLNLWRTRLRHGQELRFDRASCAYSAPEEETNRLIWLRSIDRSQVSQYHGNAGYIAWASEVVALEDALGAPLVPAIGRGAT